MSSPPRVRSAGSLGRGDESETACLPPTWVRCGKRAMRCCRTNCVRRSTVGTRVRPRSGSAEPCSIVSSSRSLFQNVYAENEADEPDNEAHLAENLRGCPQNLKMITKYERLEYDRLPDNSANVEM